MTHRKGQLIGANIKRLRIMKGVTQQEMSASIFISRSCLGNYEVGFRVPSRETLSTIATYFHVDVQDITSNPSC